MNEQTQNSLNSFIKMSGAKQELSYLKKHVNNFRQRLTNFCDSIEQDTKLEYTGWYVLLKKDGNVWKCLGTFNPDIYLDEDTEPEWDMCLPIPTSETIEEFIGW